MSGVRVEGGWAAPRRPRRHVSRGIVEQVLWIFAVSEAGGVFVPINAHLFPDQVAHIVRDCGMKAPITKASKLSTSVALLSQIPSLEFIVLAGDEVAPEILAPHRLEDLLRVPVSEKCRERSISEDLAAILYTSGSTGKRKGVMLSHANVMAGSTIVSTYLCGQPI
jgi:long-subunit acyl-CoA synthetase (AMP-forming)